MNVSKVALLCSGIHKLLASNLHVHVYTSVHFNVCKIHTYMYIHTERERDCQSATVPL